MPGNPPAVCVTFMRLPFASDALVGTMPAPANVTSTPPQKLTRPNGSRSMTTCTCGVGFKIWFLSSFCSHITVAHPRA
eukprot:142195-Chlamydomonas_euryale.AAC.1